MMGIILYMCTCSLCPCIFLPGHHNYISKPWLLIWSWPPPLYLWQPALFSEGFCSASVEICVNLVKRTFERSGTNIGWEGLALDLFSIHSFLFAQGTPVMMEQEGGLRQTVDFVCCSSNITIHRNKGACLSHDEPTLGIAYSNLRLVCSWLAMGTHFI